MTDLDWINFENRVEVKVVHSAFYKASHATLKFHELHVPHPDNLEPIPLRILIEEAISNRAKEAKDDGN